jgi:hypothetical protein
MQFSVFCEAHHIEELKRVGLWHETPPPEERLVKQCQRVSRNLHLGYVTQKEAVNAWHDILQWGCLAGHRGAMEPCFAIVPKECLRELLSDVTSDPHWYMQCSGKITDEALHSERVLRGNQALREELEKWLAKK